MGKRDKRKQDKTLEDDAAIWARVAETATPLKTRGRVTRNAELDRPATGAKSDTKNAPRNTTKSAKTAATRSGTPKKPRLKTPVSKTTRSGGTSQSGLDRQTARRLDKGRLAIEARLDLHGMRQTEAHSALRKFLHWARQKDYRHVLVITGKGSASEASSFYAEETRGVLRQSVPKWLSQGDLAPHVVSFSEAPRGLGGEGALYVRLRKSDRHKAKG